MNIWSEGLFRPVKLNLEQVVGGVAFCRDFGDATFLWLCASDVPPLSSKRELAVFDLLGESDPWLLRVNRPMPVNGDHSWRYGVLRFRDQVANLCFNLSSHPFAKNPCLYLYIWYLSYCSLETYRHNSVTFRPFLSYSFKLLYVTYLQSIE